jgi:hypothetical protein
MRLVSKNSEVSEPVVEEQKPEEKKPEEKKPTFAERATKWADDFEDYMRSASPFPKAIILTTAVVFAIFSVLGILWGFVEVLQYVWHNFGKGYSVFLGAFTVIFIGFYISIIDGSIS